MIVVACVQSYSSFSVFSSSRIWINYSIHDTTLSVVYIQSTDPTDKDAWKDKGTGHLSIKCKEGISKGTKESKPTIVIRNDVRFIVLNLYCLIILIAIPSSRFLRCRFVLFFLFSLI